MSSAVACPACAAACPDGARFCPACGAALATAAPRAVERKVVTTMFCDVVGFTALCERLDPEEADDLLRTFYAEARRAIESCGGLVEKFVGDAVVGVFGVPAAHEDDAERAVIAALRLCERLAASLAERSLQVRIGVNTGIAVVRLDVLPGSGEGFLVGDSVNMAARLQQLAPPMSVVVGETTHELTAQHIVYEALPPAKVKGKRGLLPIWLARGPVSRMGVDLRRRYPSALVDREVELGILRGLVKKVRASGRAQFALVVGEAGIGKSRLLFEFLRYIDSRPQLVRWRQGRCPSYGDEGLAFWALGEIVREQLGLREFDEAATVEAHLAEALAGQAEADWLAARLRPLLGLESPSASRDENFAAWGRFLEMIADDSPAIVVFEDLQWASTATLEFLAYLVENLGPAPLLLVGSARPELLDAHPEIAAHLADLAPGQKLVRIDLAPLSGGETDELVDKLGGGLAEFVETRRAIARLAAGNPLYAEQLTMHVAAEAPDAAQADSDTALRDRVAELMPESLQSLIAARLDGLPPAHKVLLGDAAVVGEVFWTGAVAALDHGDRAAAEDGLAELARYDLVRPERGSSVAGESEFVFSHGLIRDVAYGQLTRADRAAKHAAVARWVAAAAGERVDEVAEILAHHYATALELARVTGDTELESELLESTVEALRLAGNHALALDVRASERYYARAVELAGDSPRRPYLLVDWAQALRLSGQLELAAETLDEGHQGLRSLGDAAAAKRASAHQWYVHWLLLDGQMLSTDEFTELAGETDVSPEQIEVLAGCAQRVQYAGQNGRAIQLTDRVHAICAELRLPEPLAALDVRGYSRCALGDAGGLDDLRHGIAVARAREAGEWVRGMASNLGECLNVFEGPEAARRVHEDALESAMRVHDEMAVCFCRTELFADFVWGGQWDSALAEADELDALLERRADLWDLVVFRALRALLCAWRGERDMAREQGVWAEQKSRETPVVAIRVACLVARAVAETDLDHHEDALEMLNACRPLLANADGADPSFAVHMPQAIRLAMRLGDRRLSEELAGGLPSGRPFDDGTIALLSALSSEARGDPSGAAEHFAAAEALWTRLGVPFERAQAALGRGRCLATLGESAEAALALDLAIELFTTLGARPALAEATAVRRTITH